MAVDWGGYKFESIELLNEWDPPSYGGIYAITFKKDAINKPNTHTILYFGETSNFSTRGINSSHHKYKCWRYNGYHEKLYVSVHQVYSEKVRKNREEELIEKFSPDCNDI